MPLNLHKLPERKAPNLLQLVMDNMNTPRRAVRGANEGDSASIYIYDIIDAFWGISALSVVEALNQIDADTIHVRINSPGGDVFEARAIATALRGHKANIVAHIDSQALSAATTIALAADEVRMSEGAFFMIHNAWTIAMGNAGDMRQTADLLDKVDLAIAADYTKKTGKQHDEILQMMAAETWLNASDAKAAGFVDVVDDGVTVVDHWNLSAYDKVPRALVDKPRADTDNALLLQRRATLARRLTLFEKT